jgi:hypothetical protein
MSPNWASSTVSPLSLRSSSSCWPVGAHRQLTQTASTPDTIIEALAEQLLTPEEMPVPASAPNLLVRMQQVLRQQRGLVVVDNLETISALDA